MYNFQVTGKIIVSYRFQAESGQAEKFARYIAHEQTVEIPEETVPPRIRETVVGEILDLRPENGGYTVKIAYNPALSAFQIPQWLNLIYGNVSIQLNVRVVDFDLPETFLRKFRGPNFGIPGLRKMLGVKNRPLLATAVKPNGESTAFFAKLCRDFALGGGDIVKDDQNLSDRSFAAFKERVSRCQEAVDHANLRTGGKTLYCPIVTAPYEEFDKRMDLLRKLGVRGALLCPALIGFDAMRHTAEKYRIVVLAHPSLTGAFLQPEHGIASKIFLGKFLRLLGADASIFPNYGGRFSFSREECLAIAQELRRPWGTFASSFPMPAGGMRFENLEAMGRDYGMDSIFLIGGALLSRPEGVEAATRAFRREIERIFQS